MKVLIYNIVTWVDDLVYRYQLWQADDLDIFGVIDDDDD